MLNESVWFFLIGYIYAFIEQHLSEHLIFNIYGLLALVPVIV
jgi:hypothetical protein